MPGGAAKSMSATHIGIASGALMPERRAMWSHLEACVPRRSITRSKSNMQGRLLAGDLASTPIDGEDRAAGQDTRRHRVYAQTSNLQTHPGREERMPRLAIIDRADMNAEQARVYDSAKQSGGPVGGPYYAYIRLPKLFDAAQNLRGCLSSGPLSRREQQIANLVIARHWGARYPWFAQARASLAVGIAQSVIDAINARKTPELADA